MSADPISPDRDSAPFWRSTGGKLLIQKCQKCAESFHYPRTVCPFCMASDVAWQECSGKGTVYSYTVVRRGEPYVLAMVTLAEGPRLLTNLIDCDADALAVGQDVIVKFQDVDGVPTPMFAPA